MFYRDFDKVSDFQEILKLKEKNYGNELWLPDPTKNSVIDMVVEEEGKIISFGVVKLYAEAVMVLDQSLPARQKVAILDKMLRTAVSHSKAMGIECLHIFSKREDFLAILKKHYGFTDCYKAICLNLEG
jgi:hypothetical protein